MTMTCQAPKNTLVIILGASSWPKASDLASSEAFKNSAIGLREYLLDRRFFSLPEENLLDLFDSEKSPSDIDEEIGHFLEGMTAAKRSKGGSVNDVVVYYVGHGGFSGQNNDYFLAVKATRKDNPLISGILIAGLARTLKEKARAQRKYIILDACFSAAAYKTFQSAPMEVARLRTQEVFRKGSALICSSGPRDPSKLPQQEKYTMFTGALLKVLHRGDPEMPYWLSFADVTKMAKDHIYDKYIDEAVRPQVLSPSQEQGDISILPFFTNPATHKKEFFDRGNDLKDIVGSPKRNPVKHVPFNGKKKIVALAGFGLLAVFVALFAIKANTGDHDDSPTAQDKSAVIQKSYRPQDASDMGSFTIYIRGNYPVAEVFRNSEKIGITPYDGKAPIGTRIMYTLKHPNYESKPVEFVIGPVKHKNAIPVTLKPIRAKQ
jgi:hypothetical protein